MRLFIFGALVAILTMAAMSARVVPGQYRTVNGKPQVSIRRACPCDSIKNARTWKFGK